MLLRKLLYYGLIIRDHALHLYVFSLPDLFNKNSILDFDEDNPTEKLLLEDTFAVKEAGNRLSIVIGGRSVHAYQPTVGGFIKLPVLTEIKNLKPPLLSIRPKIETLIKIFAEVPYQLSLNSPLIFSGLAPSDFSFLEGKVRICGSANGKIAVSCQEIEEKNLGQHLEEVIIPYSQARGFKFGQNFMLVGALSRLNINKDCLHPNTKKTVQSYLNIFPSTNLFHNNLAQAIEILQAIDASVEIIDRLNQIYPETPVKVNPKGATGVGVIEAPRGTLYYKLEINADGTIKHGDIIVPTGQNQIVMEKAIAELVGKLLASKTPKEKIIYEVEKLIRAFDPCMSCAAHFLKVNWQ